MYFKEGRTPKCYFHIFVLNRSFLKALLQKYRSVLRFVGLFMGSYLFMSLVYGWYLQWSVGGAYQPDWITNTVARQCTALLNTLGYNAQVMSHETLPTMKLYVEGEYLAHIIEGCNAVSVIILFAAFVIAFAQGFKKTFLFLLAGSVLIYSVNLIRIAVLAIALYRYPQQESFLHGVVFPAMIYGMVFLLWMLWIRILKPKQQAHATQMA